MLLRRLRRLRAVALRQLAPASSSSSPTGRWQHSSWKPYSPLSPGKKESAAKQVVSNPILFLVLVIAVFGLYMYDRLVLGHVGTFKRVRRAAWHAWVCCGYYTWMDLWPDSNVGRVVTLCRCHEVAAERTLELLLDLGGIYVKIGQAISTLTHALPLEWCIVMRACLDNAKPMSALSVASVFAKSIEEGGLQAYPLELFSSFEGTPDKAASLAQVHKAKTKDGQEVAVKVQYIDIPAMLKTDLYALSKIASLVGWQLNVDLSWLVEYFKKTLDQELDFIKEAENCNRFREMFADWEDVTSPKVHMSTTCRTILTMDYVHGFNLDSKSEMDKRGIDKAKVTERVAEVIASSIFDHGYLHADPHPANIFVEPVGDEGQWRLQWLDHGLYQPLDPAFRKAYANLWVGIGTRDAKRIEAACRGLDVENWKLVTTVLAGGAQVEGVAVSSLGPQDFFLPHEVSGHSAFGLLEVLGKVPSQLVLVLKCNALLNSVQRDLGVPRSYARVMALRAVDHLEQLAAGTPGAARARKKAAAARAAIKTNMA